jgi:hypothetical protein
MLDSGLQVVKQSLILCGSSGQLPVYHRPTRARAIHFSISAPFAAAGFCLLTVFFAICLNDELLLRASIPRRMNVGKV